MEVGTAPVNLTPQASLVCHYTVCLRRVSSGLEKHKGKEAEAKADTAGLGIAHC